MSRASTSSSFSFPATVRAQSLSPDDEDKEYKAADDFQCAVVTALVEELVPVLLLFDQNYAQLPRQTGDNNKYYFGRIKRINLIATCLPIGTYGNVRATDTCKDLLRSFPSVQHIFMVGIAGICNVKELQLGDVVIGNGPPVEIDLGKETENGFQAAALSIGEAKGSQPVPNAFLLNCARDLDVKQVASRHDLSKALKRTCAKIAAVNSDYAHPGIDDIVHTRNSSEFTVRPVHDTPVIRFGVVATGEKVVKNSAVRDELLKVFNALCVEMEAAGVAAAAQSKFLIIRGMCDYADAHKNDRWHKYAAATAAAVFKEILKCMPPLPSSSATSPSTRKRKADKKAEIAAEDEDEVDAKAASRSASPLSSPVSSSRSATFHSRSSTPRRSSRTIDALLRSRSPSRTRKR